MPLSLREVLWCGLKYLDPSPCLRLCIATGGAHHFAIEYQRITPPTTQPVIDYSNTESLSTILSKGRLDPHTWDAKRLINDRNPK